MTEIPLSWKLSVIGADDVKRQISDLQSKFASGQITTDQYAKGLRDASRQSGALANQSRVTNQLFLAQHPVLNQVSKSVSAFTGIMRTALSVQQALNIATLVMQGSSKGLAEQQNKLAEAQYELNKALESGDPEAISRALGRYNTEAAKLKELQDEIAAQKFNNMITLGVSIALITGEMIQLIAKYPEMKATFQAIRGVIAQSFESGRIRNFFNTIQAGFSYLRNGPTPLTSIGTPDIANKPKGPGLARTIGGIAAIGAGATSLAFGGIDALIGKSEKLEDKLKAIAGIGLIGVGIALEFPAIAKFALIGTAIAVATTAIILFRKEIAGALDALLGGEGTAENFARRISALGDAMDTFFAKLGMDWSAGFAKGLNTIIVGVNALVEAMADSVNPAEWASGFKANNVPDIALFGGGKDIVEANRNIDAQVRAQKSLYDSMKLVNKESKAAAEAKARSSRQMIGGPTDAELAAARAKVRQAIPQLPEGSIDSLMKGANPERAAKLAFGDAAESAVHEYNTKLKARAKAEEAAMKKAYGDQGMAAGQAFSDQYYENAKIDQERMAADIGEMELPPPYVEPVMINPEVDAAAMAAAGRASGVDYGDAFIQRYQTKMQEVDEITAREGNKDAYLNVHTRTQGETIRQNVARQGNEATAYMSGELEPAFDKSMFSLEDRVGTGSRNVIFAADNMAGEVGDSTMMIGDNFVELGGRAGGAMNKMQVDVAQSMFKVGGSVVAAMDSMIEIMDEGLDASIKEVLKFRLQFITLIDNTVDHTISALRHMVDEMVKEVARAAKAAADAKRAASGNSAGASTSENPAPITYETLRTTRVQPAPQPVIVEDNAPRTTVQARPPAPVVQPAPAPVVTAPKTTTTSAPTSMYDLLNVRRSALPSGSVRISPTQVRLPNGQIIAAATGFMGTVDKPTAFMAGEAGREMVSILPAGKAPGNELTGLVGNVAGRGGGSAGSGGPNITVIVQGSVRSDKELIELMDDWLQTEYRRRNF